MNHRWKTHENPNRRETMRSPTEIAGDSGLRAVHTLYNGDGEGSPGYSDALLKMDADAGRQADFVRAWHFACLFDYTLPAADYGMQLAYLLGFPREKGTVSQTPRLRLPCRKQE